jgi:replication factor C subunit 3/5
MLSTPACRWVFRMHVPTAARIELVEALADLEHRLNYGVSERVQLGSLVGAFAHARVAIVAAAA